MSYDIDIYDKSFLEQALDQGLGDWSGAPPIPDLAKATAESRALAAGFCAVEHPEGFVEFLREQGETPSLEFTVDNQEYLASLGIHEGQIAFSVPHSDRAEASILLCRDIALALATEHGLGFWDPQDQEEPPMDHDLWAAHLDAHVPGEQNVTCFEAAEGDSRIDIAWYLPSDGLLAATVGLLYRNVHGDPNQELHTELILEARQRHDQLLHILVAVAFAVLDDGAPLYPGMVFANVVKQYFPDHPLPNLYVTVPFQWEEGMSAVDLVERRIHPLILIPISDQEMKVRFEAGDEALEAHWIAQQVDPLDWDRGSSL